jgi:hypothetical protein
MIEFNIIFRSITVLSLGFLLNGCLGGTVAQQIVRSIATSVADKAMARAMDVEDGPSNRNTSASNSQVSAGSIENSTAPSPSLLKPYQPANTASISQEQLDKNLAKQNLEKFNSVKRSIEVAQANPYNIALANTAFEELKPVELKPIAEPLPTEAVSTENPIEVIQSSQLVAVELFNLLIGEEKNAVYEQARLMGSISLPPKREWQHWSVATGIIKSSYNQPDKKIITFLIPPEFGKLPSGAVTMVELASPGELNVARYKPN